LIGAGRRRRRSGRVDIADCRWVTARLVRTQNRTLENNLWAVTLSWCKLKGGCQGNFFFWSVYIKEPRDAHSTRATAFRENMGLNFIQIG